MTLQPHHVRLITAAVLLTGALACAVDSTTADADGSASSEDAGAEDANTGSGDADSDDAQGQEDTPAPQDAPQQDDVPTQDDVEPGDVPAPDVPITPDACPPGTHDGGEGACVATGTCSDGFVLDGGGACVPDEGCDDDEQIAYVDVDHDGYGDPDADPVCAPRGDLPPGQATNADDCDDENPLIFNATPMWADADGDGYTLASQEVMCVGNGGLNGYREQRNVPPELAWIPDQASASPPLNPSSEWKDLDRLLDGDTNNGAECKINSEDTPVIGGCGDLLLSDFDLAIPDGAVVQGIRVTLNRKLDDDVTLTDHAVHLVSGGTTSAEGRPSPDPWPRNWEHVTYGGPEDTWGMDWTPEDLNVSDFGLSLSLQYDFNQDPELKDVRARLDFVSLEVFLDVSADCDDDDPELFRLVRGYTDDDGDRVGVDLDTVCVGEDDDNTDTDLARDGGDCDDADDNVYPGTNRWDDDPRENGSFDYDCDGVEEKQDVVTHEGCNGSCNSTSTTVISDPAPCGEDNQVRRCIGDINACSRPLRNVRTRCQ